MVRFLGLALLVLIVAGCATKQRPDADNATVAAVSYRDSGPPTLTLYTMINNRTGGGAHSSLMISASERVIFDPAGSFYADIVPEQNDVLFGITPAVERAYRSSHARSTHHVIIQSISVTPKQAEAAYREARQNGAVAGAFCSNATSQMLRSVPGFESIKSTFYPVNLAEQFGQMPGVQTEVYYENDSPDLQKALAENNAILSQ